MQWRLNYTIRELNQIIPEGYLTFILVSGTAAMSKVGTHFYDSVLSIHVLPMELCSLHVKNPVFFLPIAARTVKRNIMGTQSLHCLVSRGQDWVPLPALPVAS